MHCHQHEGYGRMSISNKARKAMRRAGGRTRQDGERYPGGKLKPQSPMTPQAVRHRAESLGIDPVRLIAKPDVAAKIAGDEKSGTALGRLTWQFHPDGTRTRRLGIFAGAKAEWITDRMELAADEYRKLWVDWHSKKGMPNRNPKGQQFDRRDPGHEGDDCEPGCVCRKCDDIRRVSQRLAAADAKFGLCRHPTMSRRMVEMVVIEDAMPAGVDRGERSAALDALRDGLAVLARFFRH